MRQFQDFREKFWSKFWISLCILYIFTSPSAQDWEKSASLERLFLPNRPLGWLLQPTIVAGYFHNFYLFFFLWNSTNFSIFQAFFRCTAISRLTIDGPSEIVADNRFSEKIRRDSSRYRWNVKFYFLWNIMKKKKRNQYVVCCICRRGLPNLTSYKVSPLPRSWLNLLTSYFSYFSQKTGFDLSYKLSQIATNFCQLPTINRPRWLSRMGVLFVIWRLRVRSPPGPATFIFGDWSWNIFCSHSHPLADSRGAVISFWWKNYCFKKYCFNCLEGWPRWLSRMGVWFVIWRLRVRSGCLICNLEVAGSIPTRSCNIHILGLIMKYFLQSFSPFGWFKKGSYQFLMKECQVLF